MFQEVEEKYWEIIGHVHTHAHTVSSHGAPETEHLFFCFSIQTALLHVCLVQFLAQTPINSAALSMHARRHKSLLYDVKSGPAGGRRQAVSLFYAHTEEVYNNTCSSQLAAAAALRHAVYQPAHHKNKK